MTFNSDESDPEARPDLQILASRRLGNGSRDVCDDGPPPDLGGVPALPLSSYQDPMSQAAADGFNDFACRFGVHTRSEDACTVDAQGNYRFASSPITSRTVQFCFEPAVGSEVEFEKGQDTVLTARVRDVGGALGDPVEIVVRVVP